MLSSHDLWWNGPPWLKNASTTWPKRDPAMPDDATTAEKISAEARKNTSCTVLHANCVSEWELPQWYSSWTRLVRVTAYILRFIENSKRRRNSQSGKKLLIEISELREAIYRWFRFIQKAHFSKEWSALNKNEPIPKSTTLKALNSMLERDLLLRFGGRLQNAALGYCEKDPITEALHIWTLNHVSANINHAHWATLHEGTQLTLRNLRQKYWIIRVRNFIKAYIRHCVICAHQSTKTPIQLIGNLPKPPNNPSPPYPHTGMDYAGPFGIIPFVGCSQRTR